MSRTALYPGSFDPLTNGHLDIVERALRLFDQVVVAVLDNPDKLQPLFSLDERIAMLSESLGGEARVRVLSFRGLAVEAAREVGAVALIRGLRDASDLPSEHRQAMMNRALAPEVETVCLLASAAHAHLASSILKDVASHRGDVSPFVPAGAARRLKERFR
ncbi:MAG TPA: pantetheine-phosphate adenylyltransferase [Candidatus Nitrosotalea sp.]|nr:pantetheine-phosphate adenylyltransferase [Candidatus Nitrosotalea sp.]